MRRSAPALTLTSLFLLAQAATVPVAPAKTTGLENIPAVTPAWSATFDGPVLWQRLTPLGIIVVNTTTALQGIDPDTGKAIWRHASLSGVSEETYEEIPRSPFITVSESDLGGRTVILDSMTGRVAFDSIESGINQVLSKHFMLRNGSLLVFGIQTGNPTTLMMLFDIETGRKIWTNADILGGGKMMRFLTVLAQSATGESGVTAEPIEIDSSAFLLAAATGVYRIDTRTGKILWRMTDFTGGDTRIFLAEDSPGTAFIGSEMSSSTTTSTGPIVNTFYGAYSIADGKPLWNKPVKVQGGLNDPIFLEEGIVIGPAGNTKEKALLVDYATGVSSWGKNGKGIKIQGGIVDHAVTSAGLLLTTGYDNAWNNKGTEYYLTLLDVKTGEMKFPKPLKLRGRILLTEVLPQGVLLVTTNEVNLLDPAAGVMLHQPVFSKNPLLFAATENELTIFSPDEGSLYRFDYRSAGLRKISDQAVALEGDEQPFALEIDDRQITLISSQNVAGYDTKGSLRFQVYHPAPGQPALMRGLLMAQAVRAGMAAAAAGLYSGAFSAVADQQKPGSESEKIYGEMGRGFGEMSGELTGISRSYAQAANARFKASAVSTDSVFMMVQFTGKSYGLARVDKRTGAIGQMIDMKKDKEPSYQVDAITDQVYYRLNPTQIVCYRF